MRAYDLLFARNRRISRQSSRFSLPWRLLAAAVVCCAGTGVAMPAPILRPRRQPAAMRSAPPIPRSSSGLRDIRTTSKGSPINLTFDNPSELLGPFQNSTFDVTDLGDGGQITLTFANPILADATGPDFAVFGNSFSSTYEKLAYVDVSADGQTWYRMPDFDLTPGPVGTFGATDPTNIYGLAGKYQLGYGVGFSLSEVGLAECQVRADRRRHRQRLAGRLGRPGRSMIPTRMTTGSTSPEWPFCRPFPNLTRSCWLTVGSLSLLAADRVRRSAGLRCVDAGRQWFLPALGGGQRPGNRGAAAIAGQRTENDRTANDCMQRAIFYSF